mmetsp:Transcript_763/g.1221  ORF Transcript_763/g.1221 Transcript_763/m.1221 type:complete len:508 (+) Transcript_763:91-1614(+)
MKFIACSIFALSLVGKTLGAAVSLKTDLDYKVFPLRKNEEAAVVEWGNSAIISALDGAVASFGPQTSLGAFFEVETVPVLASPINGRGSRTDISIEEDPVVGVPYPGPLDNEDDVHGNMVIMTNEDSNMSAVAMARVAKESGAAALMIVNMDKKNPDSISSMKAETNEEAKYAENFIDIPVFMVSLASGNLITSATYEEGMLEKDIVNNGMPDRVRLYGAGDRPFFEDAVSKDPILYLIHNLLNEEECSMLINMAAGKYSKIDDRISNVLENTIADESRKAKAFNVEKVRLWKGQLDGHAGKQIDERIEQVTGYPKDQFSDWHITKFEKGSKHEMHYDFHPLNSPVATITVFLNELGGDKSGGEIVYPKGANQAIMVKPKLGLAVVHHNTDFEGNFDYSSLHGERPLETDEVKYVAKKFVYAAPLPPSKRIVLPLLALASGGKLPRWVITLHDYLLVKFGLESGGLYFDKLCIMAPIFVIFGIASLVSSLFGEKKPAAKKSKDEKKD